MAGFRRIPVIPHDGPADSVPLVDCSTPAVAADPNPVFGTPLPSFGQPVVEEAEMDPHHDHDHGGEYEADESGE